ncbi:hypothetical protein ADIAL_0162 [Alkalibacterium sp. AK22]|nr:hypothetical protein ADIAL_0162 [Alkalibacterium sp. AK22]
MLFHPASGTDTHASPLFFLLSVQDAFKKRQTNSEVKLTGYRSV